MPSPVKEKPQGWPGGVPGPTWSTIHPTKPVSVGDKLVKSPSQKAIGKNIATEKKAGAPQKQAVAIALNTQREAKKHDAAKSPLGWARQMQVKAQGSLAATGKKGK